MDTASDADESLLGTLPSLPCRFPQPGKSDSVPHKGADASSRRYGETSWRPIAVKRVFGEQVSTELHIEPSYEESRWEDYSADLYPSGVLRKVLKNNPLAVLSGDNEMIEVIVGEDATIWMIHKRLLCANSSFFDAAINSSFREGMERKVRLKEETNEVFTLFVQWVYTSWFETLSLPLLLGAYVLGDKLGAHGFQKLAFERIQDLNATRCYFTIEQAVYISENTVPNSALHEFIMETLALNIVNNNIQLSDDEWEQAAPICHHIITAIQLLAKFQPGPWRAKPRAYYMVRN